MNHRADENQRDALEVGEPHRKRCLDNPVLAEHLEAIRALCREFGVLRLEAFGSVCTPEFDPERSDVDFLVEYPSDYDFGPWASRLVAFQEALAELLGRKVDLIMTRAIRKKHFLQSIDGTRQLLYAA
ncbi:MAG: nucleotidyltransferase family protein [Thermomicrobiales bacterium]